MSDNAIDSESVQVGDQFERVGRGYVVKITGFYYIEGKPGAVSYSADTGYGSVEIPRNDLHLWRRAEPRAEGGRTE